MYHRLSVVCVFMKMKNRFKSLLTLCVFGVSLMSSAFTVEAFDGIIETITEQEVVIDETEILDEELVLSSGFMPQVNYSYNEDGFLYYDQLDENNKATYEAMEKWVNTPSTEEITITLPNTIIHETESSDTSSWTAEETQEFWSQIFSNVTAARNAVDFDYPELFWLDSSNITVTISNIKVSRSMSTGLYKMKISEFKLKPGIKDEYVDEETVKEFYNMLNDSVDNFAIEGTDRYQQVKYIHDYIAKTVVYNLDAPYCNAATGLFVEPYELLCEGYSKAFKILCDKAGIPCIVIPGNLDPSTNEGHMWNYVMMEDDEWYGLDCTWDDTKSTITPVKYTYFLKGSENFNTNHTPDTQYAVTGFEYPELNADDYVYGSTEVVTTTPAITTEPVTTTVIETTTTETTTEEVTTEFVTTTEKVTTTTQLTTTEAVTTTTIVTTTEPVTTTVVQTTTTEPVTTTVVQITTTEPTKPVTTTEVTTTEVVITTTQEVTEPVTEPATEPEIADGDYNHDGDVDVSDLVTLRMALIGVTPIDDDFADGDLNNDEVINIFDYVILLRRLIMEGD